MAAPTVTLINPQAGTIYGGTSVVITGTNLNVPGLVVKFGDQLATNVVVDSATQLTVEAPAVQSPIEADVQVSTNDGVAAVPVTARFYYYNPISTPYYLNKNIYWDPFASYVFFGSVVFAQNPIFASTSGGTTAITGGTNLGTGEQVFAAAVGPNLTFRTLVAGTNVTIVPAANTLTINASAGGAGWNTAGTNSGALLLGTNSADGWSYQANSVPFAVVSSSGNTVWSGGGQFNGAFGVNATSASNYFASGAIQVRAGAPVDPAPTPANSVKLLAAGGIRGYGYGGVELYAVTGDVLVSSVVGNVTVSSTLGSMTLSADTSQSLLSNDTIDIACPNDITIASGAGDIILQGPNVNAPALANVATANAVFYNTTSGRLTYAPQAGLALQVVSQVFDTPGAHTYTPTVGMLYCQVICTAGGGSGGAPATLGEASGGGGGGGTAIGLFSAATIGVSQSVTVGAGGASVSGAGDPGNAGGNSLFGALLTANGGSGGPGSENSLGGNGGSATGGNLQINGGQGSSSFAATPGLVFGGGGGSHWGTSNAAVNAVALQTIGLAGSVYGSGGSGSAAVTTIPASGDGAPGVVYVLEYLA